MSYSFDIGGGQREVGYGNLYTDNAPPPAIGTPIEVKVLYVWPRYRSELKNHESMLGVGCCISVFATPFTLIWLIAAVIYGYPPIRERWIMKRGVGVIGSIAQKVEQSTKRGTDYVIWYRFPAADGQTWGDKAIVSRERFADFEDGQEVVVVYLAHKPRASVFYEASSYLPA